MSLHMRPAKPSEADALSALTRRSKGYWGYEPSVLDRMGGTPAVGVAEIRAGGVVVAERDGTVLGYYQVTGTPPDGELADMFLEPEAIGTGLGRALWEHAVGWARLAGYRSLRWESDPNAEPFYLRMGAERIGEREVAPGRVLPAMRVTLGAAHGHGTSASAAPPPP
ncbi:GNAT family N-acetyltransferase [Streptomyces iconiensis]|uniref:GNAT family N-acetyltransferase n=1 Tax=Streptomyces iconiensis TaxID=1384038 RepID=A0ABT7A9S3_9ACTN|nr:GNAT family N-acetyltransferase [Streptomyces iconiensis]MDJ1138106.1 GNAT family N-acetyltransferase [Streptomyces iconiensis]